MINPNRIAAIAIACTCILTQSATASLPPPASEEGKVLIQTLTKYNDAYLATTLEKTMTSPTQRQNNRGLGGLLMAMAAAYSNKASQYYHSEKLLAPMEQLADTIRSNQNPSGLFDSGNLDSPPDTGFMVKTFCKANHLLEVDGSAATKTIQAKTKTIILAAAEGLLTGGVHTPNHRWDVCAALAHANSLYPDKRYVERIDDWLGEGIDIDSDGQWAERSPNYSSAVNNPSMMNLAILLNRPELLESVRKNLKMTIYHAETNGEVETVASRRQDQYQRARKYIYEYYMPYRMLALRDGDGSFAAMSKWIESAFEEDLGAMVTDMNSPLVYLLEYPELTKALPTQKKLETVYKKTFPLTAMARVRQDSVTATIYGGNDSHADFGFGSGLAMNPAFFKMRKGAVVLDSVRMTPAFFNTGFFYPEGMTVENGVYTLKEVRKVPYHLPLPKDKRNANGQYKLSPDGRFYSKMDFASRPKQFKTLVCTVDVKEDKGAFELAFDVSGCDGVPVTIELCFRPGGKLEGVVAAGSGGARQADRGGRAGPQMADAPDSYLLKEGFASYTVGNDRLEFGPGAYAHNRLNMEGEQFSVYNGNLKAEGERVYITGVTPFKHVLKLK